MSQRLAVLLLAVAALLASGVSAAESVVLQDVRVIDGNGGPPQEHADILITGSTIAAINPHGGTSVRPDVRRVNLAGKTVLPGLISDHSHLGLTNGVSAGGKNATQANILRQLKQYAVYGVTTVTSLGLNQQSFYDLQRQVHRGAYPVADMFGADRGFGVPAAAPPAKLGILEDQVYRPATPDEARSQVRETAQRHPDLLKIWVDDFHGTLAPKMNPEIYRAVIDEAHANGLRVAAHVFYLEDAKQLVANGIDILAHGIRDQPVDDDFVKSIKSRGAWYIPTLQLDATFYIFAEHPAWMQEAFFRRALQPALAKQFEDSAWRAKILGDTKLLTAEKQALGTNMKNVKTLYDAGVKIGFGTDSGATPLRIAGFAEHWELKLLTEAGLTPLQAIETATKNAAALLHLEDRGVIAVGKLADLLIVGGDPSKNISDIDRIHAVWRRGKQIAGPIKRPHKAVTG